MWIISPKALTRFAQAHPEAKKALDNWRALAERARWANWADLKQTFGSADRVGGCVVFDVGNNQYRLIGRVFFGNHKLYILKVMTRAEYDRKDPGNKRRSRWETECRCHEPQPKGES